MIGVLALLLVHPIRDRADSQWVNAYGRWFSVALLAPLIMLLMAVGKRVDQYGVTEPRYFLLVLGLWGLGVALAYAFTASRNIKVIPMTLAGLTLLTAFGPWGAYQVSRRSQLHRLDRIAAAAGRPARGRHHHQLPLFRARRQGRHLLHSRCRSAARRAPQR